jgi:integrase
LKYLLHILEKITEAGAEFRSVTEHVDTTTPAGRMMLQMHGAFAELERSMVREREILSKVVYGQAAHPVKVLAKAATSVACRRRSETVLPSHPGLRTTCSTRSCARTQELLFYTVVRVSELIHIEVGDVDLDACKSFIIRGKGGHGSPHLFPAGFRLVLKNHLHAAPRKSITGIP